METKECTARSVDWKMNYLLEMAPRVPPMSAESFKVPLYPTKALQC